MLNKLVETISFLYTLTEDYTMNIWKFLVAWGESMNKARAAAALSRAGRYEEARRLMAEK